MSGLLNLKQITYNNGSNSVSYSENIRPIIKDNVFIGYRLILDAQQGLSLQDNNKILLNILNILGYYSHTQTEFRQEANNKFYYNVNGYFDRGNNIKYPFDEYGLILNTGFILLDTSVLTLVDASNIDNELESYYDNNILTNINPYTFKETEDIYYNSQSNSLTHVYCIDFLFQNNSDDTYLTDRFEDLLFSVYRFMLFLKNDGYINFAELIEKYSHIERDIKSSNWVTTKQYGQATFNFPTTGISTIIGTPTYPESIWENCPSVPTVYTENKVINKELLVDRLITGTAYSSGITHYGFGDIVLNFDLTGINNIVSAGGYTYVNAMTGLVNSNYLDYIKSINFLRDSINIKTNYFYKIDNTDPLSLLQDRINGTNYELLIGSGGGFVKENKSRTFSTDNERINNKYNSKIYKINKEANYMFQNLNVLFNKKLILLCLIRKLFK